MKETYFASNFSVIFEYIWSLLKTSQEIVQKLGPSDFKSKIHSYDSKTSDDKLIIDKD